MKLAGASRQYQHNSKNCVLRHKILQPEYHDFLFDHLFMNTMRKCARSHSEAFRSNSKVGTIYESLSLEHVSSSRSMALTPAACFLTNDYFRTVWSRTCSSEHAPASLITQLWACYASYLPYLYPVQLSVSGGVIALLFWWAYNSFSDRAAVSLLRFTSISSSPSTALNFWRCDARQLELLRIFVIPCASLWMSTGSAKKKQIYDFVCLSRCFRRTYLCQLCTHAFTP